MPTEYPPDLPRFSKSTRDTPLWLESTSYRLYSPNIASMSAPWLVNFPPLVKPTVCKGRAGIGVVLYHPPVHPHFSVSRQVPLMFCAVGFGSLVEQPTSRRRIRSRGRFFILFLQNYKDTLPGKKAICALYLSRSEELNQIPAYGFPAQKLSVSSGRLP